MRKPITYQDYFLPMEADYCYHIFNRTINNETLFRSDENRRFFLNRFSSYLLPVLHVYAYCLLYNHFHILARVKPYQEISQWLHGMPMKDRILAHHRFIENGSRKEEIPQVVEAQLHRFFTAYAKAVNKQWGRRGALFERPFKRLPVQHEIHFGNLIYYIHRNPTKHKLTRDFQKYHWSSYQAYLCERESKLSRQEVWDYFGGKERLIEFHLREQNLSNIGGLVIED